MRRFHYHHAVYLSFFSKALYQDVARQWKGMGFLYLLALLAVTWLPIMVQVQRGFSTFASEWAPALLQDMPEISITDGVVEVDPPGPHTFTDPETGRPFLIIDTSVDLPELEGLEGDLFILTRSKLVTVQGRRGQTRIHDLSGVQRFSLTREDVQRWLQIAANWAVIVLYPLCLVFSFMYRAAQALVYGAIGLAFARGATPALGYETLVRLAAVAVTPALLANTVMELTAVQIPLWWLMCFLIAMGYLGFAVNAAKEQPPAETAGLTSPPGIA